MFQEIEDSGADLKKMISAESKSGATANALKFRLIT